MIKSIKHPFLLDKIEKLMDRSFEYASGTYNHADPTAYSHSKVKYQNVTVYILDVCWSTEIKICLTNSARKEIHLASINLVDGELKPGTNWDHKWFKLFDKIIATQPINMSRYSNDNEDDLDPAGGYGLHSHE